jgi:hypothetical protein
VESVGFVLFGDQGGEISSEMLRVVCFREWMADLEAGLLVLVVTWSRFGDSIVTRSVLRG